jgi:NAD+ synthase (glutamine-hydrolysing)
MKQNILRVAAAVPVVFPADCTRNVERLIALARRASEAGAQITVFPAWCITGATCGDLLQQPLLLEQADAAVADFLQGTASLPGTFVIGTPVCTGKDVEHLTLAVSQGRIIRKAIGEKGLALDGEVIVFPTAQPEIAGHHVRRVRRLTQISACRHQAVIRAGAGFGESTTDAVYAGGALIVADGKVLAQAPRFSTDDQFITADIDTDALVAAQNVSPTPFLPTDQPLDAYFEEMLDIQSLGLATRLTHIHCRRVVVGISGGLDSTLALLVIVRAFERLGLDRKDILGITMPGFGTSGRTYRNALALMQCLGITMREISIREACLQHFADIGVDVSRHDVTFENCQARERTQILMDLANKENAIVVGTGDLSEIALGWCTYNGDHMSMYNVNGNIPKTVMQHLVRHIAATCGNDAEAAILHDIVDTPISPELLPPADGEQDDVTSQRTEEVLGPYELHEFFLYHFILHQASPRKIYRMAQTAFAGKYTNDEIRHWLRTFFHRFFSQQFKRNCSPDAPQVTEISLSPRGGWSMPSDITAARWLKECDALENEKE